MNSLKLTCWNDGHVRGWVDIAAGRLMRREIGEWQLAENGFYLPTDAALTAVYRHDDDVWWQVGEHRIKLTARTTAVLLRLPLRLWSKRTRWELSVTDGQDRLECVYPCPTLDEMIAQDPTFDCDNYQDFNIGVLLLWLLRDPKHAKRWLRPDPAE